MSYCSQYFKNSGHLKKKNSIVYLYLPSEEISVLSQCSFPGLKKKHYQMQLLAKFSTVAATTS